MSSKLIDRIWDHYPEGGGELLTALALAEHADPDGTNCWPSVQTVADMTRQSKRTVQYHVHRMLENGWLFLVEHGGGRGRPTRYRIPIELIPQHLLGTTQKLHRLNVVGRERTETAQELHGIGGDKGCKNDAITVQPGVHGLADKGCKNDATAIAPDLDLSTSSPRPESVAPDFDATPFITIPLIKRDGEYTVCEGQVLDWETSFPAVDVRQQLRKIREWNISNASQRKTKRGIRGHITTWLGREQDKHPIRTPAAKPIDTSCRVDKGGQRCGMAGRPHPSHGYICEHCEQQEKDRRAKGPMPASVRNALGLPS